MCQRIPVSELAALPIHWIRGNDARLETIFRSLKAGDGVNAPIRMLNCGCGKTYMLDDGGHRITAAYRIYRETGKDMLIPVHTFKANFP